MRIEHFGKAILVTLFLAFGMLQTLNAQKIALPFDRVTSADAMRQLYESDSIIHFAYKPLLMDKREYDTLIAKTYNRYKGKTYEK